MDMQNAGKILMSLVLAFISVNVVCATEGSMAEEVESILSFKGMDRTARADSAFSYIKSQRQPNTEYYKRSENVISTILIPYAIRYNIDSLSIAKYYSELGIMRSRQGSHRYPDVIQAYDSALLYVKSTGNFLQTGRILERKSLVEGNYGDPKESFRLSEEAIKAYKKSGANADKWITRCYYQQAYHYLQVYDFDGLETVLGKLQQFSTECTAEYRDFVLYNLYSIKEVYFGTLQESKNAKKVASVNDSILKYSLNSIQLLEANVDKWSDTSINPVWNYYNRAVHFVNLSDRPNMDSVEYYIQKMLSVKSNGRTNIDVEAKISALNLRAEMWQKYGNYAKSNKVLLDAVCYLDSLPDNNSLISDKIEIYKMLSKNAEVFGDYKASVEYFKTVSELEKQRFSDEKSRAFKEIETKYEVEKKETEIAHLNEQHKSARKIMWLLIGCIAILLILAALGVIVLVQRRRIAEQKYYEAALLVEQRDKAISEEFFAAGIEKVIQLISDSCLAQEKMSVYLEKLRNLDSAQLDSKFAAVVPKMTQMDIKYTICFYIAMETADIATIMSVEPASVYTVKYRLRKKFKEYPVFRFLM